LKQVLRRRDEAVNVVFVDAADPQGRLRW
jgi:hypothetical protein